MLLDTHALLWWLLDSPELSHTARRAIAAPEQRVLVSTASAWELSTKPRLGKLPEAKVIVANLPAYLRKQRFKTLAVGVDHALTAGRRPLARPAPRPFRPHADGPGADRARRRGDGRSGVQGLWAGGGLVGRPAAACAAAADLGAGQWDRRRSARLLD